jgi:hypothetical protein
MTDYMIPNPKHKMININFGIKLHWCECSYVCNSISFDGVECQSSTNFVLDQHTICNSKMNIYYNPFPEHLLHLCTVTTLCHAFDQPSWDLQVKILHKHMFALPQSNVIAVDRKKPHIMNWISSGSNNHFFYCTWSCSFVKIAELHIPLNIRIVV